MKRLFIKIGLWAVVIAYLFWGIDAIPDFIPLIGRLDDAGVLLARLGVMMKYKL